MVNDLKLSIILTDSKFNSFFHSRAPVFVQAHSKSQQFYTGIYETKGIRTDFEMAHLKRSPPHCNHLTG